MDSNRLNEEKKVLRRLRHAKRDFFAESVFTRKIRKNRKPRGTTRMCKIFSWIFFVL